MNSLSNVNHTDIIYPFNSTSRYLKDLLAIANPYFEDMGNQIYAPELQLDRANVSDNESYPLIRLKIASVYFKWF